MKPCPICGAIMTPGFNVNLYCPNNCDKKAIPQPIEDETTTPIKILCPKCKSPDVVRCNMYFWYGWKCVDCKHTWQ